LQILARRRRRRVRQIRLHGLQPGVKARLEVGARPKLSTNMSRSLSWAVAPLTVTVDWTALLASLGALSLRGVS
jgi:hypothetical protein